MATGLFNEASGETLLPFIQGRYILPYFDEDGQPVFLISRSIETDTGGCEADYHGDKKTPQAKRSTLRGANLGTS